MKKKPSALKKAKRNLHLVMAESAITAGLMSMSVMTPFFNSIGLNNEQISLSQIIFTVVVIVLNIPTGYLADRVSRKWANIIGDFAHGVMPLGILIIKKLKNMCRMCNLPNPDRVVVGVIFYGKMPSLIGGGKSFFWEDLAKEPF